ncbi:LINE-1 retrotransposable element ORF2 protein [Chionoecetes opilio]|uniref:LINE-1 retrotransposable element ORF2 protein n=1 Tax=Chionoecetes opilio TaxID=41210 RepID=A0A8J4YVB2_CHIOP|nr:LINE-1 retrotransposable element ORF2 protein [Chionoecetes opilio]
MILTRLQWQVGSLHHHIYAYTANKGTTDCITEMLSTISDRKAVVTFMDLEKAFEMASGPVILASLAEKGVQGRLLRWTQDFLSDRQARVILQGTLSDLATFENGTPQGSILSPFLFNILVENLVSLPLGACTKILGYADDLALITTGPWHAQSVQTAITAVGNSYVELGLKINTTKTKAVHFDSQTPRPPPKAPGYQHKLGQQLPLSRHLARLPADLQEIRGRY